MSKDDIIKMAREACDHDKVDAWQNVWTLTQEELERFFHAAYEAGAAAEREACAKACEEDAFVDQWKGLAEAVRRIRERSAK